VQISLFCIPPVMGFIFFVILAEELIGRLYKSTPDRGG